MKNTFFKLSILAILSTIIGCGPSGEDYDPPSEKGDPPSGKGECPASYWNDYWSYPGFISFFDDSLAIYKTIRYKTEYYKKYFFLEGDKCVPYATERHTGLWLANYRSKQKPLLVDTLDYDLGVISGYFKDSSLLVIKDNNKFGFWKIGRSSVSFKEMDLSESAFYCFYCSFDKARPWIDDNILTDYSDYVYNVLNTKTGKVEEFDILEQDEGLSACKDMSYINGKILCLRKTEEGLYELVVDNVVKDTSRFSNGAYFYGNYVTESYYGGYWYTGQLRRILKIDPENFKFDETFTPIWLSGRGITFYNDKDNLDEHIEYSEKDFE
jgi:predicted small lipoprotein YifL